MLRLQLRLATPRLQLRLATPRLQLRLTTPRQLTSHALNNSHRLTNNRNSLRMRHNQCRPHQLLLRSHKRPQGIS